MNSSEITDLNIQPDWLRGVLEENPVPDEKYISVKHLAKMIGAKPEGFARYVIKIGIEPVKRFVAETSKISLCITENQAKEVVRVRIKNGYEIKPNRSTVEPEP